MVVRVIETERDDLVCVACGIGCCSLAIVSRGMTSTDAFAGVHRKCIPKLAPPKGTKSADEVHP